jgi:hypothetical protein
MNKRSFNSLAQYLVVRARLLLGWIVLAMVMPPLAALAQGASAKGVGTGPFRDLSSIESALLRGATTQAQVRSRFGEPNGGGAARFASVGGDEREIWYYEDIELTGAKAEGSIVRADLRQQILLVIFKGGVVDGYLWTSNAGTASSR